MPAAIAPGAVDIPPTDAVIVDPFNPNEIPFEFENVTAVKLLDVVPAEMLIAEMPAAVLASARLTSARRTSISLSNESLTVEPLEAYDGAAGES